MLLQYAERLLGVAPSQRRDWKSTLNSKQEARNPEGGSHGECFVLAGFMGVDGGQ
jgi:hypothetical protein